MSQTDKCRGVTTNQTRPNAPGEKVGIRTEDNEAMESQTHPNGLEVDISSGDLKKDSGGGQLNGGSPDDL